MSAPKQTGPPAYVLEGSRFDVRTAAVAAMPPADRIRFIRALLKALSREIRHSQMRLAKRIPIDEEMRDLRKLCRTRQTEYLRLDETRGTRDVLMFGAPGRTHVEHSAHANWRMETSQGHLETQISTGDARLVKRIDRYLTDPKKEQFRKREAFLPGLFGYLKTQFAVSGAFPPFHARLIAERYLPKSGDCLVVDPCAGHGGRLLGMLCAKRSDRIRYIGTDPNTLNQRAYTALARRVTRDLGPRYVKGKRSAKVVPCPFEDWIRTSEAQKLFGKVDLVFTSPPYFSQEQYDPKSNTQSAARYTAYDEWRRRFLHPLIDGASKLLKPGGVFVLNIADVAQKGRIYRLEKDSLDRANFEAGFILDRTFKLAMPVRPGGQKLALRHQICVNGNRWKYEPVFVFWKEP